MNKVIESLKPKPQPTGTKDFDVYTSNNGGHGLRQFESNLYHESLVERIKEELSRNSEAIGQFEYVYKGIKYRII